ncbi:MAG: homoserine dehydrogenase [Christensenellaceae bacterium]|jgi:homoserine dehydrogenase|nr:homoserine dehydrogenase [Christensenellaceae bacterium]
MAKIGLLGHGVVGGGVAEILLKNAKLLQERVGQGLELTAICDLRDFSALPYADLFTKDAQALLTRPDIDIVVECMGGVEPARSFVLWAIEAGKHVVTSNKALVVAAGEEIIQKASERGVRFLYEASTGGGIPVIGPLRQNLAANRIDRIAGILNGTTNYILTRMRDGGASFAAALKEAQQKGYAEKDPSADVEGDDARRKICILCHVAFGSPLSDEKMFTEGITKLEKQDMLYAKELGRSVKLIALGERVADGFRASVAPAMLPGDHPLAGVSDVFNAVLVNGDMVGDVLFYGRGAGQLPTASAIVGDLIDIVLHPADRALASAQAPACLDALSGRMRLFSRVLRPLTPGAQQEVEGLFPGARLVTVEGEAFAGEFALISEEGVESELRARFARFDLPHGAIIRYISP